MATKETILRKMKLIEKLMGMPKKMEYTLYGAYGKWQVLEPYNNDPLTPLLTKNELEKTLDCYYKGMTDYKNRVKIKKKFNKYKS